MSQLIGPPPFTPVWEETEFFHGTPITDPFRWLEEQESPSTRDWIEKQKRYARTYLDSLPGRDRIRSRIRELLAVETYETPFRVGSRYFFRKRLPDQEQPCIYMREGIDGVDQLLTDPARRNTGSATAVKPLSASSDGRFLLYEVKQGGERTGTFEILDVDSRQRLPDVLPHGYLRGFAFAPEGLGFYYVTEALDAKRPFYRAVYLHHFSTPFEEDKEVFKAGEDEKIRLSLFCDDQQLLFFVYQFREKTLTSIFLQPLGSPGPPEKLLHEVSYTFGPRFSGNRILAITDYNAPNSRIVEIRRESTAESDWIDIIPERDTAIDTWLIAGDRIFVSYLKEMKPQICIFDLFGKPIGEIPVGVDETVRIMSGSPDRDEVLLETESFTQPIAIHHYSRTTNERMVWAKRNVPFDSGPYSHRQVWFASKDGTRIPMFLVGRAELLEKEDLPIIMTSYGGSGISMTPQFSVFVAFLMERGCLFALPNIRGGSEFGAKWHNAARRRNRQTAYDDFLCAAEWLIQTRRTSSSKLGIFGGSNSGLLVGAALTQRPDLFRAVVCIAPVLDMLRYHQFDNAHVWKDEFGTAEDPEDFVVLAKYSPYHQVRQGVRYPATLFVSGDADRNCNPLHVRKMVAKLQMVASRLSTTDSDYPIIVDYSDLRGHSPVLPLTVRVDALTDRMAFLCDHLGLPQ